MSSTCCSALWLIRRSNLRLHEGGAAEVKVGVLQKRAGLPERHPVVQQVYDHFVAVAGGPVQLQLSLHQEAHRPGLLAALEENLADAEADQAGAPCTSPTPGMP